jgi:hypothetical protein
MDIEVLQNGDISLSFLHYALEVRFIVQGSSFQVCKMMGEPFRNACMPSNKARNMQSLSYQKPLPSCFLLSTMSAVYAGAIEHHCPNVTMVLDHFRIVKALNNAVDQDGKVQWRKASIDERKALKGRRWLLFKHSSNRSKKDSHTLNALRKGNRRIHRAWVLKDEFEHFWEGEKRSGLGFISLNSLPYIPKLRLPFV